MFSFRLSHNAVPHIINQIICQIPATVTSKLFPPRIWMACAAVGWGMACVLMSTTSTFAGLVVCRLMIGIFEAGFGPAIPLYFCKHAFKVAPTGRVLTDHLVWLIAYFYTKEEMGLRLGYWFGFAAVAGACGGLIAFAVQHAHTAISHWRLLFIVEVTLVFLECRTIFANLAC